MAEAVGEVIKVSGPLVVARNLEGANMYELVRVGVPKLYGEVIEIRGQQVSIQVYEETEGIKPGEPVVRMKMPLSVDLGPGLIGSIYDGVQRPLDQLRLKFGDFVIRGAEYPALDRDKRWRFQPALKAGAAVAEGDILGMVQETVPVQHKIMVPPGIAGKLESIEEREARVEETIAVVQKQDGATGRAQHDAALARAHRPPQRRQPVARTSRWSPDSGSSTCSSRWPRAARPAFPGRSAAARPSCSTSWPNGPTPTSSSTSAAASAATR